ncbi:hypothetical protein QTH90_08535 [Variovorax sp. J2P1-59]|uniref:hypothetical protein n=1 Tax=Variovorax flavidus TaxID=3053501 RepID=UPI002574CFF7|nr:hypothetical protein [Variovorax sp. J2P1-59]MDM0074425.1 hypothetical protein [Variovorax sp. J2P1-59]
MPKFVRDQVTPSIVGKTQALGIKPSTAGIASRRIDARRISRAVRRGMDAATMIGDLLDAHTGNDPAAQEIANRLLANKEFLRAMLASLEMVRDEVKASIANRKAAPHGADYPESLSPNHQPIQGSGLPGTDVLGTFSTYTKDMMLRDLATQNAAAARIAKTAGMDAAEAAVARTPLIPPWDSNVWTEDARAAFRKRAEVDGFALAHIAAAGDGIGMRNDTMVKEETESAMARLGWKDKDLTPTNPRSFDR